MTRRRASSIIAMSEGALGGFPVSMRHKVLPIGNVGFCLDELPEYLRERHEPLGPSGSRCTILFSAGRLVHWKGYSVLLKACAKCLRSGGHLELWIGGGGPDERRLRRLAAKLGIQNSVKFLGHLPDRDSIFDHLARCDIFVMPTFHDGPPVVFLEAMAVGKPIICLDLGGASEIITEECGVKLAVLSIPQVISDLAAAITRLGEDSELRSKLGEAGRRRVETSFSWNKKGDIVADLYQKLLYC